MTAALPLPVEVENPRWLCGCGREHPIDGPAYPVCSCGQRCRIVTGDNVELRAYVGSPAERLENAHRWYADRYQEWAWRLRDLRTALSEDAPPWPYLSPERIWRALCADHEALSFYATEVDRVESEVAAITEREERHG